MPAKKSDMPQRGTLHPSRDLHEKVEVICPLKGGFLGNVITAISCVKFNKAHADKCASVPCNQAKKVAQEADMVQITKRPPEERGK